MTRFWPKIPPRHLVIGGAAAVSASAFVALGCVFFHVIMKLSETTTELSASHQLHADITEQYEHREAALMLALKAGGAVWVDQVADSDAKLRTALRDFADHAPNSDVAASHAADALAALVVMARHEGPALDLVRRGERDVGLRSIATKSFYEADAALKTAVDRLIELATTQAAAEAASARRMAIGALWSTAIALVVILAGWFVILRDVAHKARQLAAARTDLEAANAELELRSRLREASFFEDNPIAMFEVDYSRPLAALQRLRADGVDDLARWFEQHPGELNRARSTVRLVRLNAAALRLLRLRDPSDFFADPNRYLRHENLETFGRFLANVYRGELEVSAETLFYAADETPIPVLLYSRPMRGHEDTFSSIITSAIDISELKTAEAAADAAKIAAEEANAAKSQFLAAMSHEIRTPLNGVLGMASVLARSDLKPRDRDLVHVIEDSGTALLAILNDLLDLSKIEAGRFELDAVPFDIADVVAGAEALFTPRAAEKGVALRLEISADARGVYMGDATRVRQILYNLLSNAVKFTDAGAVFVTVDAEDDGGRLVIEVADTGPGIAPERMSELFLPFRQGEMAATRRHGGTGLGLSICRRLAQMMGGDVTATSRAGRGSTFTVTLSVERCVDVDPVRERDLVAEDLAPAAAGRDLRVLVVEDNSTNQKVIRAILEPMNAVVDVAENGEAAVAAWAAKDFDFVLMDVQMPVMDGLAATREIRARETAENRPRTPIVALTANAMNHQIKDYVDAGMDAHVAKPIEPALLFQVVKTVLTDAAAGRGRAADAA